MMSNHVNVMVASNSSWIVPVGNKERRFFILDISNAHTRDYDYFEAIDNQMNKHGGISAMIYDLLSLDISEYNLREAPKTSALTDHLLHGLQPFEQFWCEKLFSYDELGDNDSVIDGFCLIEKSKLYDEYISFCDKMKVHYGRMINSVFGEELKKYTNFENSRPRRDNQSRYTAYKFPTKDECRNIFEEKVGMKIEWNLGIAKRGEDEVDEI